MRVICRVIAIMLFVCLSRAYAEDSLPSQKEYEPPSGKGRVVVVVSGQTGPGNYTYYAKDLAEKGFYAVLVDGNDFWIKGGGGEGSPEGCYYSRTTVATRFAGQGRGDWFFSRRGLFPDLCGTDAGVGFSGCRFLSGNLLHQKCRQLCRKNQGANTDVCRGPRYLQGLLPN